MTSLYAYSIAIKTNISLETMVLNKLIAGYIADIPHVSIVTTAVLILLVAIYYWIKNWGILPGPRGLPYVGLFPYLTNENVLDKLEKYKKRYGDMYSFTYTGRLYMHLSSIKAMKEIQVQKSDCFAERFSGSSVMSEIFNDGLFMLNGERWKNLRKFFIQKFKTYGLNAVRDDLAGPLYDSLNAAIEDLKTSYKKPVNFIEFLSKHGSITMRKVLFGEKGVTDKELSTMLTAFAGALDGSGGITVLLIGPMAKFLLHTQSKNRKMLKHISTLKRTLLGCAKRIESSMKGGDATCVIEEFYKEKNERKRKNDSSWKYFNDQALVESVAQFAGDGILSVAVFIAGFFNTLLEHPEEQEKIYSEIMDVIGPNRQPSVEDRPNLPYTNAFLNECCRMSKFLSFFPSLECTKETTIRGYKIPKGTITLLNFYSAHMDESTFENPSTFNPSRYLQTAGKPKAESPVTFGLGKRMCTGEPYVMMQSFLFLTTIIKNFKVVSSNNPTVGVNLDFFSAGKLEINFVPRKGVV